MMGIRLWPFAAVLACISASPHALAAEMSVGHMRMRPGDTADLAVNGGVEDESTFAWTIMLELVPRPNARGTVTFTMSGAEGPDRPPAVVIHKTPANVDAIRLDEPRRADVDVRQLDDVWPEAGTFTPFDTHKSGAARLNGAVDDNGTLLPTPVSFSGVLAGFPVVASPNARGIWDVVLATSVGDSGWEGAETKLVGGTITVSGRVCRNASDCNDRDACTEDICDGGFCVHSRNERDCDAIKATRLKRRSRSGK